MQQKIANPSAPQRLKPAAVAAANWLIDLVFPPLCWLCGRPDVSACEHCLRELEALPIMCLPSQVDQLERVYATGIHEGELRKAVQAFKYDGVIELADVLAWRLNDAWERVNLQADALLPVPLHAHKQAERGYNQAELLCRVLADKRGLPCEPGLLQRVRNTKQQVKLSHAERVSNVQGAFEVVGAARGRSFLLVDDVVTTGATLGDCARALREAGAKAVFGIAVSTPKPRDNQARR